MTIPITLVCCTCGESSRVEVNHAPQFAFEVAAIASEAGLVGVIDHANARALVFCSDRCLEFQKTKGGNIRRRLLKMEQSA